MPLPSLRHALVHLVLAALALPCTVAASTRAAPPVGDGAPAAPDFRFPADSLRGRFHRIGFGPTTDWYLVNARRDSMRTEFEKLLADHLRSAGLEVMDATVGRAIGQPVVDSLGGLIDPRTGHSNAERAAAIRIRIIESLLVEHGVDGLLYWAIVGSAVAPGYSIVVTIEDRKGWPSYEHRVGIGTGASFREALGDHARNAKAVRAVLDPFCEAVFRK